MDLSKTCHWFKVMVVFSFSPWLLLAPRCISTAHLVPEMPPVASSLSTNVSELKLTSFAKSKNT